MSDLISRQAVAKFLNDWLLCLFENCHKQSASDLKMIIKDFKNMPSAQLNHNAEVSKMGIVHCEDCEHWDTSWETAYGLHYCPMIDMSTKKNFFCKYGAEKRGEIDETD